MVTTATAIDVAWVVAEHAPERRPSPAVQDFAAWLANIAQPAETPDPAPIGAGAAPAWGLAFVRIAPGERWCIKCGESTSAYYKACERCGSKHLVEATAVLQPGEFGIAT
jgi:hypothetical protein